MFSDASDFARVLAAYAGDCQPHGVLLMAGAGGFSGSRLWRLATLRGPLCLRRWPAEFPDVPQLQFIHGILIAVANAGFRLSPVPISTVAGNTFVEEGGHLWELSTWLPGEPDRGGVDRTTTSAPRIEAALTALAEFHHAAAGILGVAGVEGHQTSRAAPGIVRRSAQLQMLLAGGLDEMARQIGQRRDLWPELGARSTGLLDRFRQAAGGIVNSLTKAASLRVPIQPCIRDIHREHVLFEENQVTGIVDFGSMQPDNITCDIARLLGSMAQDDRQLWQHGLRAYEAVRPLSEAERQLVGVYDESAVLLSGIHWLQWVFVQQRRFDNPTAVLARFDEIAARLTNLTAKRGQSPYD